MSGFTGRRGLNNMFSNIANLNVIPSDYDLAMQQRRSQPGAGQTQAQQDSFNMQSDLDLFTNAQFFDFDMGDMPTQSPAAFNETDPFSINQGMTYFDGTARNDYSHVYSYQSGSKSSTALLPSQPHNPSPLAAQTPPIHSSHGLSRASQHPSAVSSPGSTSATPIDKRKFDILSDPANQDVLEEATRVAAEEDKRRRNTAASARFRVKKKQREAALEKSAKDMTDRLTYLENRVHQLEMENKLLKDLITEKSGKEGELAELERSLGGKEGEEVEPSLKKKGVGTGRQGFKAEA